MKSSRRVKNEAGKDASNLAKTTSINSLRSGGDPNEAGDGTGKHTKVLLKPADQIQLNEQELAEEFTRILNANNPKAAQNIARYNFKERIYKATPNVEHHFFHFENDGFLVYKGDDAKRDEEEAGFSSIGVDSASAAAAATASSTAADEGMVVEEINEDGEVVTKTVKKAAVNKNQFNFSDRATQTINNSHKERSTNTEPPPQKIFSASVTQWEIYDAYVDDEIAKEKAAKEKSKASGGGAGSGGKANNSGAGGSGSGGGGHAKDSGSGEENRMTLLPTEVHNDDILNRPEFAKSAKILERMANQNTYEDVAQDYKYWEDASDEFREGKGTLLPLWNFLCEVDKRKQVTAMAWSPSYPDLFMVGYGSYDFMRQGPGLVACFSIKNPSYPEILYQTDTGVLSLDIHKSHPSLMAVGMYDGTVAVYDLSSLHKKSNNPASQASLALFKASQKSGKHLDPVWQVVWGPDDLDGHLNFYSISSDGRVSQWTLLQNELVCHDIICLKLFSPTEGSVSSSAGMFGWAAGTCISFHPTVDHLFVIGTEEGYVHQCSKTYHNEYLGTLTGHQMSVYAVKYNPFSGKVVLTAGADWTVRLWDMSTIANNGGGSAAAPAQQKSVLSFDLNSPVGDIAWAPYSSTIFAACTAEGKIFVYDLNENKYEPICEQFIVRKTKLTHLCFNPTEPILLAGDDKGNVISLKLSPNLRKKRRASDETPENERIEKIVAVASGQSVAAAK